MDLSVPKIMGILNITPDSFYSGSRVSDQKSLLIKAEEMITEGADILDIGGYSSRPGARDISAQEEKDRVLPAVEALTRAFPDIPVSIDTFRSEVAREALDLGASMINDISGGDLDPEMADLLIEKNIPYVMMHMKGTPQTMVKENQYGELVLDVIRSLQEKISGLNAKGVSDIIVDPGFGFAKNIDQNFWLLKNLGELQILERPILVGISRKSMIYKSLKIEAEEAIYGTVAAQVLALNNGAALLRVHDVRAAAHSIKIFELYRDAIPL